MTVILGTNQFDRENQPEVLANREHVIKGASRLLDAAYFPADDYQNKWVKAGLVMAVNSSTKKYVPWNASAAYGPGSDVAYSLLDVGYDATYNDPRVSGVTHAVAVESRCYVWGSSTGDIPQAAKDDLKQIVWR